MQVYVRLQRLNVTVRYLCVTFMIIKYANGKKQANPLTQHMCRFY